MADQITVEVCIGTDLHLSLPMTDAFARADLDHADAEAEVERPSAISEGGYAGGSAGVSDRHGVRHSGASQGSAT